MINMYFSPYTQVYGLNGIALQQIRFWTFPQVSLVSADAWSGELISWQIAEVQKPSQTAQTYLKSVFTAKLLTFYWPKQLVIL